MLVAIAGVAIPVAALVALFALTLSTLPVTAPASASASGLTVEVTGRQWFWDVAYPAQDVANGERDPHPGRRSR